MWAEGDSHKAVRQGGQGSRTHCQSPALDKNHTHSTDPLSRGLLLNPLSAWQDKGSENPAYSRPENQNARSTEGPGIAQ